MYFNNQNKYLYMYYNLKFIQCSGNWVVDWYIDECKTYGISTCGKMKHVKIRY